MSRTADLYAELTKLLRDAALLDSCGSVLGWDEQTGMPKNGAALRAEQLGLLAGLAHERLTAPRIGELLSALESQKDLGDPDSDRAVNIREARRTYDRKTKLPRRLVEELTQTTTLGQQAWIDAREKSDFAALLPWLEKMVKLKCEEAQAVGFGKGVPYDALLDDYEPGMTAAELKQVFSPLRDELVKLLADIQNSSRRPDTKILSRHYPKSSQIKMVEAASRAIGFDFEAGSISESAHPFCSGFGPGDCRLTTRYNEQQIGSAFFGVMHESGHGIYEQGLPGESFGLGVGQATSLGIHESQSRFWENFVGRSRSFWQFMYPSAKTEFKEALGNVSLDDFYFAINDVRPSLVRVEADEVTYNLHIMLRFEIEEQLIAGTLKPADIPAVWNEKFKKYFGLAVPSHADGCMQDIHWSAGLFGYFPTYALGNMYAGQFFAAAGRELGDLDGSFARGEFKPLKEWLNQKIHRHGKRYRAKRLVEIVTGESLSHKPLVAHLRQKYSELYAF